MKFDSITEEMLIKAGYRKQHNGFTRKYSDGRFHAYISGYKLDIHYDLYSDNSLHPLVFPMPLMLKDEVKRIKDENRTTESGNMDKE